MNRTALILVDIQRDFWQPLAHEPWLAAFPENVRTLLATARRHGVRPAAIPKARSFSMPAISIRPKG